MNSVLLGTGLACLIGAIVGGGMKGFGVELPLLQSLRRQVLLGAVGLVLIAASAADNIRAFFSQPSPTTMAAMPAPQPMNSALPPANEAALDGVEANGAATHRSASLVHPIAPHVAPVQPLTPTTADTDANIIALKSQLQGDLNRMALTRSKGQTIDCEVERSRLLGIQHALANSYAGYHIKYVPDDIKNPPPPDPCTQPDGGRPPIKFGGP